MIWEGFNKEDKSLHSIVEYCEQLGYLRKCDEETEIYSNLRYNFNADSWGIIITAIHKNKKSVWIENIK